MMIMDNNDDILYTPFFVGVLIFANFTSRVLHTNFTTCKNMNFDHDKNATCTCTCTVCDAIYSTEHIDLFLARITWAIIYLYGNMFSLRFKWAICPAVSKLVGISVNEDGKI